MPDKRPNILVFLTDDHGAWATGPAGNHEIITPTMDRLAREGANLTRAFTPCPVSSPARASFFTGLMPSAHGIHDWLHEASLWPGDVPEGPLTHPALRGIPHLGHQLQRADYQTALCGKWHCGKPEEAHHGFDYSYVLYDHRYCCGPQTFLENGGIVHEFGHQAPIITHAAQRFLDQRDTSRPFFLFVGFTNTHTPHRGEPAEWVDRYRHSRFDDIPDETDTGMHGRCRHTMGKHSSGDREKIAQYYAAVSTIDQHMGQLLDRLEREGVLDDTLVLYTSDHGHMMGHHGLTRKGNWTVPMNFLEESILVPSLWRWPGGIEPGRVIDDFADHCDVHATLLDAAGVLESAVDRMQRRQPGQSLLGRLSGRVDATPIKAFQVCEYATSRMIRTRDHKLIVRAPAPHGDFPDELYDLANDPRETCNVIGDVNMRPTIVGLRRTLEAFFAVYDDPMRSGLRVASLPGNAPYCIWNRTYLPGEASTV